MNKKISLTSLIILIIASIDNMRNLPAAALFGSSLIFFFLLSALLFLIPTALMAAELSAAFPDSGGIYQWVHKAFGKQWGFASVWLQWINTMIWYPTMLTFVAATFAYLIDPALAQNKAYLITSVLIVFWGLTLINLKGFHVSALVNNICGLIGTIIPLTFIIALGALWVLSGQPVQIQLTGENLIPPLNQSTSWVSLIAIMASFLGIELSGVHVNDIRNPQRNFPKAVFIASVFIFLSLTLGSLSIAAVVPEKEINLISGVMLSFDRMFSAFGLQMLTPLFTLLIVVGSVGTMINWLISPAKGLLHAAELGFLPAFFAHKNRAGVASRILLTQAVLVSIFSTILLLEPNVNAFYWFLTALSTELYMIMYIFMFCAGLRLHYNMTQRVQAFKIPGKQWGIWSVAVLGMLGCTVTIIVSFFPPDNIPMESPTRYFCLICAGNLLAIAPILSKFKRRDAETQRKHREA